MNEHGTRAPADAIRTERPTGGRRAGRCAPRPSIVLVALLVLAAACRGGEPERAELRPMVDSLLPTLERLSGLEARGPIRLEEQSREAMREYVQGQIEEDLTAEDLAGLQAVYRALGLIPDTLELEPLLLELYTEQVIGYYDPETEALYVMEGVPQEALESVVAHELVHAIQDQHVDLDSLIAPRRDDRRSHDRQLATQAAVEGHATLVMFTLMAERQAGGPVAIEQLPDLGRRLGPAIEAQNEQFPVFREAPRIIRETLLFPYLDGAAFVQALWRAAAAGPDTSAARPAPLDTLLPRSTEQVLHPRGRFLEMRDAPTRVVVGAPEAAAAPDGGGWRVLYENTLGELETSILLSEHLGAGADTLAHGWDGDRYLLMESLRQGRALVWYSVWDDTAAADAFADAYRRLLDRSPARRGRVERLTVDDRPLVRVVDTGRELDPARVPLPAPPALAEPGAAD